MKKRKRLPVLILASLLISAQVLAVFPVYAAGRPVYDKYIVAYFSSSKSSSILHLYYTDDSAYIAADDMAAAAGMDVDGATVTKEKTASGTKTRDTIVYTRKDSAFSCTVKVKNCLVFQDKWYVPLQSTAKALHARYMYDEERRILIFQHTEKLEEDLIDYAKFILGENKASNGVQRYYLADFAGTFESAVASAFNVLVEKGIFDGIASLAVGSYGREKYEKAIAALLNSEDTESIAEELENTLKDADEGIDAYLKFVSTADTLTVAIENDLEAQGVNLFEQFGEYALTFGFRMSDTDQLLKAYHDLNYFGPADFMALYHNLTLKEQSCLLYLRAFNYGLGENEYIQGERELSSAIKGFYPFTKEGEAKSGEILSWAFKRVGEKLAKKVVKKATDEVKKAFIKEAISELFKETKLSLEDLITTALGKIYAKYSRVKKWTDAVEQSYLLSQIQYYAAANMRGHSYKGTSDYDPVAVKYSLLLYLRAAQVGFENFEFDKDLKPHVKTVENALKETILEAASWQDNEMNVPDEAFPMLDFTKDGFFDSVDDLMLKDGVHRLIFDTKQIFGDSKKGYTATVYELNYVTFKDSFVKGLKKGDKIGGITIRKMDWLTDTYVVLNDYEMMLIRLDDGLWYQTLENDMLVTVETEPFTLRIPSGVQYGIYLQSPWDEEAVKDLETLLTYRKQAKEEFEVHVENGKIVKIVSQYRP